MLRSDLCDYSDPYIVAKGKITVTNPNDNTYDKNVALKNNAPFLSCISKINNTLIDNAEDLDIVMPMYNLLEYSKNYRKTTGLIIIEMNQIVGQKKIQIILLKIQSLSTIKQILQEN